MSEITNKELAISLKEISYDCANHYDGFGGNDVRLMDIAAERLEAMPEAGEQEPIGYGFTDLNGVIRFFRKEEDANQAAIDIGEPGNYCPFYTQPQQPAPDENAVNELMRERDNLELMLDRLSSSVAVHFGEDVGEHTSANSPWENAIELLDRRSKTPDKETIKRYCLEFLHFGHGKPSFSRADEDLFEKWWQQQSAEDVE